MRPTILLVSILFFPCACSSEQPSERAVVFAAASTSESVSLVIREFPNDSGNPFMVNYAATSTLARQINQGARAGIFIAAHPDWVNYLDGAGFISRRDILCGNRLVLVEHVSKKTAARQLLNHDPAGEHLPPTDVLLEGRIAIGDPEHVPAGRYAVDVLRRLDLYETLTPAMLPCRNVREALRLVELGEARFGLVYATDARQTSRVRIVTQIPADWHEPIIYEAALLKQASNLERALYSRLLSESGSRHFQMQGFTLPGEVSSMESGKP